MSSADNQLFYPRDPNSTFYPSKDFFLLIYFSFYFLCILQPGQVNTYTMSDSPSANNLKSPSKVTLAACPFPDTCCYLHALVCLSQYLYTWRQSLRTPRLPTSHPQQHQQQQQQQPVTQCLMSIQNARRDEEEYTNGVCVLSALL